MNFYDLALSRQSCRKYDKNRNVEPEKIKSIINSGILAPSACNSQPYHITVATGKAAKEIAKATTGMGMNSFTENAPVMLVISEQDYNATAKLGAKLKNNDYRSIDIGILAAYLTAQAESEGLGCCILGWFSDDKIRKICKINSPVRLVISLGYASEDDKYRTKKRKPEEQIVTFINE